MTNLENEYLQQSNSWMEGMRYRYSPDSYPITKKQYSYLKECGQVVGQYLNNSFSDNILEFRLDMVKDSSDRLWIMEIQTDDRGMPAMAIARNSRGSTPKLPGLIESLDECFTYKAQTTDYSLAIIYPDNEYFYYAGLYDVRNIFRMINPGNEVVVTPLSELTTQDNRLTTSPKLTGATINFFPDFIWDFSDTITNNRVIQTKVNKSAILKPWIESDCPTRKYIAEVRTLDDESVKKNPKEWILKPIDGQWSRGIIIGSNLDYFSWVGKIQDLKDKYIAQRYIYPTTDYLMVENSKDKTISRESFIARIEPYFVRVGSEWTLADILATCTKYQPIRGSRDCIMIPAKIL